MDKVDESIPGQLYYSFFLISNVIVSLVAICLSTPLIILWIIPTAAIFIMLFVRITILRNRSFNHNYLFNALFSVTLLPHRHKFVDLTANHFHLFVHIYKTH